MRMTCCKCFHRTRLLVCPKCSHHLCSSCKETPARRPKPQGGYKAVVKASGEFVIDYIESAKPGTPRWYVGRGRVPGNTAPIPSGLHHTQRQAWKAAAEALGVAQ